ncbi:MAG: tetratricopeptide repeat protein [Gemmatimonadetes bacterium]|nr:tetratricopeptide repeat protein [Gemmatimonadota bacterium]MDA1104615.1 tetratricopeptide repeat protein [Gemmatimonadota bacterium]
MSIESLKQQARKHEQSEDWHKALESYNKALAELARDEQVDIGLYNRVGDLCVRVGELAKAVVHYEKAVDLYREAYLPNNAIAVCKKVIRNVPDRHKAYLQIGQIRAEQGFLSDARTNFLTYAERMQAAGDLDESFRALIEFCDRAPEDVGVRITVADQMAAKGMGEQAIEQLLIARRHLNQLGETRQVEELETKVLAINPEADLSSLTAVDSFGGGSSVGQDGEIMADFGEISLGGDAFGESKDEEVGISFGAMEEAAGDSTEAGAELAGFEISHAAAEEEDDSSGDFELPTMNFGDDEGEAAVELPTMDFEDDEGEVAVELPIMDFADEEDEVAVELPTMDFEDEGEAAPLPAIDFALPSDDDAGEAAGDVAPLPVMEEYSETADALEDAVVDAAADSRAEIPFKEAPKAVTEPPAARQEAPAAPANEGYVDFGAMILGGGEEKTTRFTVAYEEPSGDEAADFAKMLSQFKEKVSENMDSNDVRAHSDLGTAYKEMGLLDEAISSFQAALRASPDHLPTYELMGQTFMEMGKPEAAVKSLERALESRTAVEDELVGIYYYLGRAYESLDRKDSAIEFYDQVFSLDINFADVTERLRELR